MVGRIVVVIVLQVDGRQNQDQIKVKTLGDGGKKGGGGFVLLIDSGFSGYHLYPQNVFQSRSLIHVQTKMRDCKKTPRVHKLACLHFSQRCVFNKRGSPAQSFTHRTNTECLHATVRLVALTILTRRVYMLQTDSGSSYNTNKTCLHAKDSGSSHRTNDTCLHATDRLW